MICARCGGHAEDPGRIADSTGESATVCMACGAAWLAEVVTDWDTSLRVFLGTATLSQRRAHERRLRVLAAAAEETAARDAARREKAREVAQRRDKAREAAAAAAALQREHRARIAARFVAAAGRPVKRDELARVVGCSPRTLSRVTPLAVDRGWIVAGKAGIQPGPVSVPRDPDRVDLEDAELATVGVKVAA